MQPSIFPHSPLVLFESNNAISKEKGGEGEKEEEANLEAAFEATFRVSGRRSCARTHTTHYLWIVRAEHTCAAM